MEGILMVVLPTENISIMNSKSVVEIQINLTMCVKIRNYYFFIIKLFMDVMQGTKTE
jgi:hypothetical protein